MSVPEALADHVRASAGRGQRLDEGVARFLQEGFGADLSAVRIHTDERADQCARLLGARAFTAGADVYFAGGRPRGRTGLWLLAHEIAHVVQQAGYRPQGVAVMRPGPRFELDADADAAAGAVLAGAKLRRSGVRPIARRLTEGEAVVVQCHSSWEHRMQGEIPPAILEKLVKDRLDESHWRDICRKLREFYVMWEKDGNIDKAAIDNAWSNMNVGQDWGDLSTVVLDKSGLVVTYGELNALPDYMANPGVIDEQPREMLEPIFQTMRQESHDHLADLIFQGHRTFKGAIKWNTGTLIDKIMDASYMDSHTQSLGTNRTNALLARNACHFAPYSWYRWQQFHKIARDQAQKSYAATDQGVKDRCRYQAVINNGYADHFLQDSFASGHLINKTLVMQWFVEWVSSVWYNYVARWDDSVKYMTSLRQPGLSARQLYDPEAPGAIYDPQTAEEQASRQARMDMCGVMADQATKDLSYDRYLWFMSSMAAQLASGAMHDHYCEKGLWVSSRDHPTPYQVYGDEHLLDGGDGVRIAAETSLMSRHAIQEILGTGTTSIKISDIYNRFPSSAASHQHEEQIELLTWHGKARDTAFNEVFKYNLSRIKSFIGGFRTMPNVSQDMPTITEDDMTAPGYEMSEPAGRALLTQ
ncbi:DUF4157 domain-containing protein [Nonomuraea typhae]|uniref:DUF4157 domain-containing protein n=1 Tax=Nonomuraea typhae TaxID=2603600 RepID=A0ABW7ZD20_9ACTN